MIISTLLTIHEHRHWVPSSLLSISMVPMGGAAIISGALSWVLPRQTWEALDNTLYRGYMRLCLFVFENVSGVDLIVSGDVDDLLSNKERAIILSNHQSNADWAIAFMLAARHSPSGALESLRFMVKHSIQYVPLFGWYIFQHGYIFVRRAGAFMKEPVLKQLKWLDSLSSPYWLLIFPEGTRITPETLYRSKQFRRGKGLEHMERVLSPRAAGLKLCLDSLDSLEAIYDITIAYSQEKPPGMFEFVCCPMNSTVHVDVRRREPSEARRDPSSFLEKSFMEKEYLMAAYSSNSSFFPPEKSTKLPPISMSETVPVTTLFISVIACPFFSPIAAQLFIKTIWMSPLLFAWLKITKSI
ncbi:hypothetical protein PFISCL1PPCAC_20160 [Pristionchus fissidentatus]|uniref:Phospholipid/glycerol acyltransferase domain-containing protein n=1 Tax=Pristionchus fissidentatus TaxID=1538716 RepID=A0AAV5WBE9_9BILA|nr:hypothetical protein PFISCL1PPCAC_20160 [Pristionchus fissidentatus]